MKILPAIFLASVVFFGFSIAQAVSSVAPGDSFFVKQRQSDNDPKEEILYWLDRLIADWDEGDPHLGWIKKFRGEASLDKVILLPESAPLSSYEYFYDSKGELRLREFGVNYEIFKALAQNDDARYRTILESTAVFQAAGLKTLNDNADLKRREQEIIVESWDLLTRLQEGKRIDRAALIQNAQRIIAFEMHLKYAPIQAQLLYLHNKGLDAVLVRRLIEDEQDPVLKSFLADQLPMKGWVNEAGEAREDTVKIYLFAVYISALEQQLPGIAAIALAQSSSLDFLWDEKFYNLGASSLDRFFWRLWANWTSFLTTIYPYAGPIRIISIILAVIFFFSWAWESPRIQRQIKQKSRKAARFLKELVTRARYRLLIASLEKNNFRLAKRTRFGNNELSLILKVFWFDKESGGAFAKTLREAATGRATPFYAQRAAGFPLQKAACVLNQRTLQLLFYDGFFDASPLPQKIQDLIAAIDVFCGEEQVKAERDKALTQNRAHAAYAPPPKGKSSLPRFPRQSRNPEPTETAVSLAEAEPREITLKEFLDGLLAEGSIQRLKRDYFIDSKGDEIENKVENFQRVAHRLYLVPRNSRKEKKWGLDRHIILERLWNNDEALKDLLAAGLLLEPDKEKFRLTDEAVRAYGWWIPRIRERRTRNNGHSA